MLEELTEKGQRDVLHARVAQPDVHAGRRAAGTDAREIEPLGHERFLRVDRLVACAGAVGVQRIVAWAQRRYHEQHERRKRKLDHHVQTGGEERKGKDVLCLAVAFILLEHPLVVHGDGDGKEVPRAISVGTSASQACSYHRPISTALMSIDWMRFWSASFSSSFESLTSSGTTRFSSSVLRRFLRRLRRRSCRVSPVSSSSWRPSALMLSSSRWSLSVRPEEASESLADPLSSPSSRMWSEWRRRCLRSACWAGPAREEERLRAWWAADAWSSMAMVVGVGGWTRDVARGEPGAVVAVAVGSGARGGIGDCGERKHIGRMQQRVWGSWCRACQPAHDFGGGHGGRVDGTGADDGLAPWRPITRQGRRRRARRSSKCAPLTRG
jgi:hypothetical protein